MKHHIQRYWRLFTASFLLLFLELALIRWIPGQITLVSYFSNLILMGSFLGMGLGLMLANRRTHLLPYFSPLLLVSVCVAIFYRIQLTTHTPGIIFFGAEYQKAQSAEFALILIFCVTAIIMIPIAQEIGRCMRTEPPLTGYSVNILGSITGIIIFSLLSWVMSPPFVWFTIIAVLYIILLGKPILKWPVLAAVLVPLTIVSFRSPSIWSSYHKLTIEQTANAYMIYANNIPHQVMIESEAQPSFYFAPYRAFTKHDYKRILVIGAGTGSDIAIALAKNPSLERIDALEIDPVIVNIGKKLHPEHPYDDPRVHVVIGDARTFLQTSRETYDLILYALPDSLTITNFSSNIRLESFLFTRESFTFVKKHLAPNGLFALYNYYRETWLVDKIGQMLTSSFGYPPYYQKFETYNNAVSFMTGPGAQGFKPTSGFTKFTPREALTPASDDWPFLYLKDRTVPGLYVTLLTIILAISAISVYALLGTTGVRTFNYSFFLFGAAFLLLEVRSVATFQLLFGSTWYVNALVFGGVLTAVLVANVIGARMRTSQSIGLTIILFLSLLFAFLIPPDWFLRFPPVVRFFGASTLYFLPILAADIIFSIRFKTAQYPDSALGANVLGSVAGGILEYASLAIGYRMLLAVAGLLYALVLIKKQKSI